MAKSLRSKIMRRWRKLKRGHVENVVEKQRLSKVVDTLNAVACGQEYRTVEPKNAFLHPEDAESKFPQFVPAKMIDLRSSAIPGAGLEWRGANRKSQMITNQFKAFGGTEINVIDEDSLPQSEEEVLHHERMHEERTKNPIKKAARKTKLRKTMVF